MAITKLFLCVIVSSTVLQRLEHSKLFDCDDGIQAVSVMCVVVKCANYVQSMLAVASFDDHNVLVFDFELYSEYMYICPLL